MPIIKVLKEKGITLDTHLRKISKQDYSDIGDLYSNGKTFQDIANLYSCSKSVISNVLHEIDVEIRPNGFTSDDALNMYQLHQNGNTFDQIAKIYNTDRHTIGRVLKRNRIVIDKRIYSCNEHYFDIIDTQDKAYILGLFWSDGHNDTIRKKITIQLQERDKEILEDINILIDSDRPLWLSPLHDKNENWQNTYTLTIQSKHMSNILENYGMVKRKSLVLEFPLCINESLYRHFIRGYFDGDGCISCNQNKNYLQMSMFGTPMVCGTISDICKKIGIKTFIYNNKNRNPMVCTFGITNIKDRIKFFDWIYDDANLKLKRKYNKYYQFINNNNINNSLAS